MSSPQFIIKAIDRDGREVRASEQQFTSRYGAELASLDLYGDHRYKLVWVERSGYHTEAA